MPMIEPPPLTWGPHATLDSPAKPSRTIWFFVGLGVSLGSGFVITVLQSMFPYFASQLAPITWLASPIILIVGAVMVSKRGGRTGMFVLGYLSPAILAAAALLFLLMLCAGAL